jgi:hypothetical protein
VASEATVTGTRIVKPSNATPRSPKLSYHSWERGQNENANGLLRQHFPKTMGLLNVTAQQVMEAVHKLNNRPRKGLGFKTPYEVFRELSGMDAEKLAGYALVT